MAKFSGQITLAEVQSGKQGTSIGGIVSWYQVFHYDITPTLENINKETFKNENSDKLGDPSYNWKTTPQLPTSSDYHLWVLQEIIYREEGKEDWTQLTAPTICGNAVTAVMVRYSSDGHAPYETEYRAGIHFYIEFSYDGGQNWTSPIKIVGLDGVSSATTVYAIESDYGEVLKFTRTEEEIESSADGQIYTFAPNELRFSLSKTNSTGVTKEPMYVNLDSFREEPIREITGTTERTNLYKFISISYLSKNINESQYWKNIDLTIYRKAFFDDTVGEGNPQLIFNPGVLFNLAYTKDETGEAASVSEISEIFDYETLIKIEAGYWDLVTIQNDDGTLSYEEKEQTFSTFIPMRFALDKDLAKFSVNAHDITASIANAGLRFDSNGLHVKNGSFEILKDVYVNNQTQTERVFYADVNGNLTLKGAVYATSGRFEGAVYASEGEFTGKINAGTGELGFLTIRDALRVENLSNDNYIDIGKYSYTRVDNPSLEENEKGQYYVYNESKNAFVEYQGNLQDGIVIYKRNYVGGIKSSNYDEINHSTGFYISDDGHIYANELVIGANAEIKDKLKIGENCFIQRPNEQDGAFIKVINGNQTVLKLGDDGTLKVGSLVFDGKNSSMSSSELNSNYSWLITPEKAIFNNIVARGSIESSVFKYGEVSAVGGIILARPASKVTTIQPDENAAWITLEDFAGFPQNDPAKNYGYCLFTHNVTKYYYEILDIEEIMSEDNESVVSRAFKIQVLDNNGKHDYNNLLQETLVYLGNEGSAGISINGSDDSSSFTPPRAITVYTLGEKPSEMISRIVLGQMPQDPKFGDISGTYGLYAENVYLKGSLVTETPEVVDDPKFSGISTSYLGTNAPIFQFPDDKTGYFNNTKTGRILLWAGAENSGKEAVQRAKFRVDEYGNMYAGSGYFEGSILTNATIQAATIRTARIEGYGKDIGEKYGLTIHDLHNGISFTKTKVNEDTKEPEIDEKGNPLFETLFSMTDKEIVSNIPLKVKDLEISEGTLLKFDKLDFKNGKTGLGIKPNHLAIWDANSGVSKLSCFKMENDGLGLYLNQSFTNEENWGNPTGQGYSRIINFGQNITIGSSRNKSPSDLIVWGGITLGDDAQIIKVEGGFDINI